MDKDHSYRPIDCNYYDELTLLAMRKALCFIRFKDDLGKEQQCESIIKDIYTKDKVEYLLLVENDQKLRLDRLLEVRKIEGNSSVS